MDLLLQKFIPHVLPQSDNKFYIREIFGYSLKIFMGITFYVQQMNTLEGTQETTPLPTYIHIATY